MRIPFEDGAQGDFKRVRVPDDPSLGVLNEMQLCTRPHVLASVGLREDRALGARLAREDTRPLFLLSIQRNTPDRYLHFLEGQVYHNL